MNLATVCLLACLGLTLVESATHSNSCTKATRQCLKHLPKGRRVQKVCGTDHVTYKNRCLLEQRVCRTGEAILVAHQGGCKAGKEYRQQTPNRVILVDQQPTPQQPEEGEGQGDRRQQEGEGRGDRRRPGGGGSSSQESGSSEEMRGLDPGTSTDRIPFDRVTVRPRTTTPTPSKTTLPTYLSSCPRTCPIMNRPVCGSDGNTYRSPCLLKAEACRLERMDLVAVYAGACVPECGGECEALYDPVCGTNGVTFMSRCTLDQTACRAADETLTVAYKGECFDSLRARGCQQECEDIIQPVCSSSGMTYKSRCEFERYQCVTADRTAFIAEEGACPGTSLECYETCPDIPFPVCASNNITYPSICDYSIAHCRDSNITLQYSGPCVFTTPDPCEVECSLDMNPVCASNNASYFNRCFLNLAACKDPSITYVREGKCDMTS